MLHAASSTAGADRAKLRDAIEALKNWPAVSGIYSYSPTDHMGMQDGSAVIQTISNGAFALPGA